MGNQYRYWYEFFLFILVVVCRSWFSDQQDLSNSTDVILTGRYPFYEKIMIIVYFLNNRCRYRPGFKTVSCFYCLEKEPVL